MKGEPIVEVPDDARVCFLTTGIDHLVVHDRLISKYALLRIAGRLVGVYSDVAAMNYGERAAGVNPPGRLPPGRV